MEHDRDVDTRRDDGLRVETRLAVLGRGEHQPGRIRLSLTPATGTVGPGLSEELTALLAGDPASWQPDQRQQLEALFDQSAPELAGLRAALAAAEAPLAIDPAIIEARGLVARLSVPTPPDPVLEQLNRDVALSQQQLADARLTAAQDLTWALINSPAFLFNH